jgi:hypothetical protein
MRARKPGEVRMPGLAVALLLPVAGCGGGIYSNPTIDMSCPAELLVNGAFDQDTAGWSVTSVARRPLIYRFDDPGLAAAHVTPQSPEYLAWLGHADSDTSMLTQSQPFEVPARARSLSLSGRVQVQTNEDFAQVYDQAFLELITDPSAPPTILDSYSNLSAAEGWSDISASIPSTELPGPKLILRLRSVTDDAYTTDFFFDSLSLMATCDPQ